MSYEPQTLLDARDFLQDRTGLSPVSLGIVGDSDHRSGYHLGRDRIFSPDGQGDDDYSVRTTRDRAGLTDAAMALDIGQWSRTGLRSLTAHMVSLAKRGRLPDVRELIGPGMDGRAYKWDHLKNWTAVRRPSGDSHEFHLHISYYRDSEHRSKLEPFQLFFKSEEDDGMAEITKERFRELLQDAMPRVHFSTTNQDGDRYWAGELMNRDQLSMNQVAQWSLGVASELLVMPAIAELRGQIVGLITLVEQLLTTSPVDITPEQLTVITEAASASAREGAAQALERTRFTVDPVT